MLRDVGLDATGSRGSCCDFVTAIGAIGAPRQQPPRTSPRPPNAAKQALGHQARPKASHTAIWTAQIAMTASRLW